jgi:hypothetical protein
MTYAVHEASLNKLINPLIFYWILSSIVSDYGLDDRVIEVRFPTGVEDFSSSP